MKKKLNCIDKDITLQLNEYYYYFGNGNNTLVQYKGENEGKDSHNFVIIEQNEISRPTIKFINIKKTADLKQHICKTNCLNNYLNNSLCNQTNCNKFTYDTPLKTICINRIK